MQCQWWELELLEMFKVYGLCWGRAKYSDFCVIWESDTKLHIDHFNWMKPFPHSLPLHRSVHWMPCPQNLARGHFIIFHQTFEMLSSFCGHRLWPCIQGIWERRIAGKTISSESPLLTVPTQFNTALTQDCCEEIRNSTFSSIKVFIAVSVMELEKRIWL